MMAGELERLVDERTEQLQLANQELESFSYSVSHDLRAPLRHIVGFSQLLEKSLGKLPDPAARHLRKISDAAIRGGQLVDDLLAFSRMGRKEMLHNPVALAETVRIVQDELALDHLSRAIEWEIGELPTVRGDAALLRLVMKNLLENALKYTRGRTPAKIAITARQQDNEVEVAVADNGVGFDMRYVDKLFGVFQRLHSTDEFEGNGIGLALVRRIVQRHRGRTWGEGRVGEGATIYFTLPI
jgi:light-regulated signal transduction histidine kinase (bacteriophytochrome)